MLKLIPQLTFVTSILCFFTLSLLAQENSNGKPLHIKIKRLNDSYIDVYYNKPIVENKLPVLIFCQGSGYDSNTEGFLKILRQFDKKVIGLTIEKQGVQFGDKGDTLSEIYKPNNMVYNRLYDYLRVLQYMND